MTILEMVSDVSAKIGDPLMDGISPLVIKRWVRQANHEVQNKLYPLFPELFTKTSSSLSNANSLPSDYYEDLQVTVGGVVAVKVTDHAVGAIGVSSLYPSDNSASPFYHLNNGKFYVWPQSSSGIMRYRRKAKEIDYDIGKGNIVSNQLTATTPAKNWTADYWFTPGGKVVINGIEYTLTDSGASTLDFTAGDASGVEYEVYIPTLVPSDHHDLIVQFAVVKALQSLGRIDEAMAAQKIYGDSLALVLGGVK
jgi:hypothetical protein